MAITEIRVKRRLPYWFDIENYISLDTLTINQLVAQIRYRVHFYNEVTEDDELFFYPSPLWKQIQAGTPIVKPETKADDHFPELGIANTWGVMPLSRTEVKIAAIEIQQGDNIEWESQAQAISLEQDSPDLSGQVWLSIALKNMSDEEIISDIRRLLPQWRQQLQLQQPYNISRKGERQIAKLLTYQCIPFIDLLLWEKELQFESSERQPFYCTNNLIAEALFCADDMKGATHVRDTIRPFVKRLLNGTTLRELDLLLAKEPGLKTRSLHDHLLTLTLK